MIGGKRHIACGLDRTLAYYDGWRGPLHIGHPIPAMVRCLQEHLKKGEHVTIFSSRIKDDEKTGIKAEQVIKAIGDWTEANVGARLDATNVKLHTFDRIYDNIAVQVVPNTGKRVQFKKEMTRSK
jgi:hypothetical protein